MKHIYHYHAIHQSTPGAVGHLDGIATLRLPVETDPAYLNLKRLIAETFDVPVSKLTICSLTLLSARGDP